MLRVRLERDFEHLVFHRKHRVNTKSSWRMDPIKNISLSSCSKHGKIHISKTNIKLIVSHGIHCHQFTWDANGKCSAEVVPELIADHEESSYSSYFTCQTCE